MDAERPLQVLWWGRHGNYGPDYPRNRTLQRCMARLGWSIREFQPRLSALGDLEAAVRRLPRPDLVWVPCFRQRDLVAAARWAGRRGVPLVFDPLISAYDKRVFERRKYAESSARALRLLRWERALFARADALIADTRCHAEFFAETLGVDSSRITILPVSAEEEVFYPASRPANPVPEALFFGTFIELQGVEYIAEAVGHYTGPPLRLTFLGKGPLRARCESIIAGIHNPAVQVVFEEWLPFAELADRVRAADLCLGVFGTGRKTARVIPNKVYQALACARPVITVQGDAYPPELLEQPPEQSGIRFVAPGDPRVIAAALAKAVQQGGEAVRDPARSTYECHFSNHILDERLQGLAQRLIEPATVKPR